MVVEVAETETVLAFLVLSAEEPESDSSSVTEWFIFTLFTVLLSFSI